MAADYCTAAEVKAAMPDGNWGATYDALIALLAARASRAIDRYTKREPGAYAVAADSTRYFTSEGDTSLYIGELAAAPTTVSIAEAGDITDLTALAATDYILEPYNALAEGLPYNFIKLDSLNGDWAYWPGFQKSIVIVGKFGYSAAVQDDVKQCSIIQCARWFKRGQQGFVDTGAIVELGQLTYVKAMDPDILLMVDHLRKVTI